MNRSIILFPFIILSYFTDAQTDSLQTKKSFFDNKYFTASYQNGYVFPTNDFVRGINAEKVVIDAFQTFSLKLTKQTTGSKFWEQNYKYPEYGVGISILDFHNPEEIGIPIAFFLVIFLPHFYEQKNLFLPVKLAWGLLSIGKIIHRQIYTIMPLVQNKQLILIWV